MSTIRVRLALLVAALALSVPTSARQDTAPGVEPTSGKTDSKVAGDTHAFDGAIGRWQGTRSDGIDGSVAPMTLEVRPVLGGTGQIFELEIGSSERPYRGFSVQVFDPDLGRWVRQYVNGARRSFVRLEGEVANGKVLWRVVPADGARQSRLVSERPAPGRWRRTMSVSEDGGQTWRVLWVDELEAVKPLGAS